MAVTGDTELAPTKNDLILEVVQRELQERAQVISSGCMTDLSARVEKVQEVLKSHVLRVLHPKIELRLLLVLTRI